MTVETQTVTFADGPTFVRLNAMALIGMSAGGSEMSDEDRRYVADDLVEDAADLVRSHTDDRGFSYEISATVATARG